MTYGHSVHIDWWRAGTWTVGWAECPPFRRTCCSITCGSSATAPRGKKGLCDIYYILCLSQYANYF